MSDANRKNFSDKMSESLTPESQKSTWDKGKEFVTDTGDKLAGKVQPEDNKGLAQGINDSAQQGADDATGESWAETGREYMDAAKHKLNDAVEYVSKSVHGGDEK
ncbi:12 kDa heat shock protein [Nakaseomyces bracarensis]|uniref:12 kDa heat shock protein n=1 Tax=Nakaseomyces bracarensis TaxID=273131 RepID=A0ABR4NSS1_9SACH